VIGRPELLNRFSGFHRPKPLKRLKFNGLACTQLKQGVNETCRSRCSKTGMRRCPARRFTFALDEALDEAGLDLWQLVALDAKPG
jgi:hypothetical protein